MTGTAGEDFAADGRNPRAAAFSSARRHSRLVHVLRIVLPVSAMLLVGGVILAPVFDPRHMLAAKLDADSMGVKGSTIVMDRPKLTGYGSDGKGYEVTAGRAEQDMNKAHAVDLFELKARMAMREDGWAELTAASGHIDNSTQMLDLFHGISVVTDLGDRATLSEARVDFGKNEITTSKPVEILFDRAELKADTMQLFETGRRAVFTGRIRMVLQPNTEAPVSPAADTGSK